MKQKLSVILIPLLMLGACASVNDKTFNGQNYNLEKAELSDGNPSRYTYINRSNINQVIGIEHYRLEGRPLSALITARMQQEKRFRRNDCQIEHHAGQGGYYLCRYRSSNRFVVYTFSERNGNGYMKVYVEQPASPPNQAQIEQFARQLHHFEPI